MTKNAEQEDFYEAFLNKHDEIMFAIAFRENQPEDAKIIYDGGEHALFYRSPDKTILLDYLHPEIRDPLTKCAEVLISEVTRLKVEREYNVPVKIVKKLPLDKENIIPPSFTGR
ncbi:MAG: hypothetical protein AB7U85_00290 [Alphaproteobacteria bacterium]